jgi:hypothetical protein
VFLRDIGIRTIAEPFDKEIARLALEVPAEHRLEALVRVGRFDDEAIEIGQHVVQRGLLAQPPRGDFRQHQLFADEPFGDRRQETQPGGGFEHTGA